MKKLLFFLICTRPLFAADMTCVHVGDSQSSRTPFSKRLQENFKNDNVNIFTYARPSSRASHWGNAKYSQKYAPQLTKGKFYFHPSKNNDDKDQVALNDSDKTPWVQTAVNYHNKKSEVDCVIFQLGDNVDSLKGTKSLLASFESLQNKPQKCYWVTPTWSEPERGYKHMNDQKKIEIRRTIEKALEGSNCKIISTTGHGDIIDYSFKEKLKKAGRYTTDGLHLNTKGGQMWADAAYEQITKDLYGKESLKQAVDLCAKTFDSVNSRMGPPQSCPLKK